MKTVSRDELAGAPLWVDCLYRGSRNGNSSDDPLHLLLPVSNQGGFRIVGTREQPKLVVMTTSRSDPDWPDEFDPETGLVTYFGDNKKPGHLLHETPRYGNRLLQYMFEKAHGSTSDRQACPPTLIFARAGSWRDMIFLGLAVPGAPNLDPNEDLVAVWKSRNGSRFQNYRAKLTVLNEPELKPEWVAQICAGNPLGDACPAAWREWADTGIIRPLRAPRSLEYRKRDEQLPIDQRGRMLIERIHAYFSEEPTRFEACAARLAEMMLPAISGNIDLTRAVRDGGRDATGYYRIGEGPSGVLVEFALEAKCYAPDKAVGVKELSRLISRLRHRQFGVLVTTSFVGPQAYQEIKEDQHPIVIICGADMATLLVRAGISSLEHLDAWLQQF